MLKIRNGDIIEFKRRGIISAILGRLLKVFEREWDMWGWHVAIIWERSNKGWYLLEAIGSGVKINYYSDKFLAENTRCWQWFDKKLPKEKMWRFLRHTIDKKYDVAVYFWTTVAIIIRHYVNRPIPKLLDDRFTCWELVQEFTKEMNAPILSKYDVIILPDLLVALQANRLKPEVGMRGDVVT